MARKKKPVEDGPEKVEAADPAPAAPKKSEKKKDYAADLKKHAKFDKFKNPGGI